MKITTKLQISTVFSLGIALAIGLILSLASQKVNKAIKSSSVVYEVVKGVSEMNSLLNEYLLHHKKETQTEWQIKYNSLSKLLSEIKPEDPAEKIVLGRAQKNHQEVGSIFSRLVKNYERQAHNRDEIILCLQIEDKLVKQLAVNSHSLVTDTSQLAQISYARVIKAQKKASLLVMVFILTIIVVIGADISKIKRLNEELEHRVIERTSQLKSANEELRVFSLSLSRELQTFVRQIDDLSAVFIEKYSKQIDEEGKRMLDIIQADTRKAKQFIVDLLLFSRVGREKIKPVEIDMVSLAKEVFAGLKSIIAPDRNIQFNVGVLPLARGDKAMIQQVFVNLFSNSLKFTKPKEVAVIEVGGKTGEKGNTYYIRDNGVGFDMKDADKLFGVFQRLHSKEEFKGIGVGLAIVQRIINRHGGYVWAEGKINEGAVFYFNFAEKL